MAEENVACGLGENETDLVPDMPAPAAAPAPKPAAPKPPAPASPFVRAENEDDDGYDPWSDRPAPRAPLFERDPWS